jgi:hypothetical protein
MFSDWAGFLVSGLCEWMFCGFDVLLVAFVTFSYLFSDAGCIPGDESCQCPKYGYGDALTTYFYISSLLQTPTIDCQSIKLYCAMCMPQDSHDTCAIMLNLKHVFRQSCMLGMLHLNQQ